MTNGKVVTVGDQFRIVQAVAVRGDRIVAAGTNQTSRGAPGRIHAVSICVAEP